jgi:stearoyl-CoA desaturase (delta-9 desaturase)
MENSVLDRDEIQCLTNQLPPGRSSSKADMSMAHDEVSGIEAPRAQTPRRLAFQSPRLSRMQLRHFVLFNIGPLIGTAGAVALAFVYPIGRLELAVFFAMWLVTGLGLSAGYHRLFTHRSYKVTTPVRVALAVMGSMAGLGPVISWSAMHRRHHQCSDAIGDMHSPNLHGKTLRGRVRGFVHSHFTWMIRHEYPNIAHYTPDLLEDQHILRVSRNYMSWVVLGLALPGVIGGLATGSLLGALSGFLWGGVVRMFVVTHSIYAINSVTHTIGTRPFRLRDDSRNNLVMVILAWGEGWHHNHHAFPTSASFGLDWYRIDISYWFILLLKGLGLASDVKLPAREQIRSRNAETLEALAAVPTGLSNRAE